MPPRSVADATRFTPTGPHAFDSTPTETPAERVARLRQAAREDKAKKAAGTTFDRIVERGRRVADVAHRVTAVGLIAATVLCGGLTIYAVTDLMVFNRRRRTEYLQTHQTEIAAERTALIESGQKTAEQIAAELEANRPKGPWEKLKGWAMSGLTPADQQIKPIFEEQEGPAGKAPVLLERTEAKAEEVKRDLQGVADQVKQQVGAVKAEEEKASSGGILSKVKGLWGGR